MLKKLEVFVKRIQSRWFLTSDDKVWKEWVDFKQREAKDLVKLLTSDVKDNFKRRAIFLLLVPSKDFNPIYWKEGVGDFYQGFDFVETLTPDLLSYATDLVVEFYVMLKKSVTDGYNKALRFYNACILWLLEIVSEEQQERIFPLFSLRDISIFRDETFFSGYNPFESLLFSKVDEKWKKLADAMMRQIIKDELSGKTKPREEWENALQCYAFIIQLMMPRDINKKLHYSVDLLADQILFLFSEDHYGNKLINSWDFPRVLQFLSSADVYKELRYRIAKFVVFNNKEEFRVWNKETFQAAEMMLKEFGQSDYELAQRIQTAIEESEKRNAEYEQRLAVKARAENDIVNQMRR
ncbi:MAG: hypothetical protein PHZ25_02710 [Candidatus Pacebacteria bacterium]|nr:hypothetical protein [Candidatus Paceibacterota bacterium]